MIVSAPRKNGIAGMRYRDSVPKFGVDKPIAAVNAHTKIMQGRNRGRHSVLNAPGTFRAAAIKTAAVAMRKMLFSMAEIADVTPMTSHGSGRYRAEATAIGTA